MFIVTITRREQQVIRTDLIFRVFQHGAWNITVGVRSDTARITECDDGFSVVESPLATLSSQPDVPVAAVEFIAKDSELRISKPLFSGRPLYFHLNTAGEFFCSTHIACLRDFGVKLKADEAAIPEFLIYHCLVPPATLYKSIGQIPLGAHLCVRPTQEACAVGKLNYWLPPQPDSNVSADQLAEEAVGLLTRRLQKLEPMRTKVCVLLSGGLDSTTLFRVAQRLFGLGESYSTGFPFEEDHENIERHYAESAAEALGSKHHYYQCAKQDYLQGLLSALAAAEEPVRHLQSVLLWLLFKGGLPPEQSIVLSGEGADGMFGVELQRRLWRKEHRSILFSLLAQPPVSTAIRWLTNATKRGRGFFESVTGPVTGEDYQNPDHELWSLGACGNPGWVLNTFGCDREDLARSRFELVSRIKDRSINDIISILGLMSEGTTTQCLWSKLGEACGRFIDYPFLDPGLLAFAFRTSWEQKLREPKRLIRAALRRMDVPEFIICRPKSSFGLRHLDWAKRGGVFEPLVALASKVFPEDHIRSLQNDTPQNASTYWALLNYALWKRLSVDGESLESLQSELGWQMKKTALSDSNRSQPAFNDSLLENAPCR